MEKITYRKLEKQDYKEVQGLINTTFGLHNYVDDEKLLEKIKKMYLCSCLAEQKFNMVAVKDGEVVGIIMGASDNDKYKSSNIINFIKLSYYTSSIWIMNKIKNKNKNKNKTNTHSELHRTYSELIKDIKNDFNGVLTLFAVKEDIRGFGVGKELLAQLNKYYLQNNTNSIYLYTDDTCNYGFYDHMGFSRLKEKHLQVINKNKEKKLEVYLYGFKF